MSTEITLNNDTIEKLMSLLRGFNSLGANVDLYSLCIKQKLNEKLHA